MSAYIDPARVKVLTSSATVTTENAAGILYSINIYGTTGDETVTLIDGGALGTPKITITTITADQSSFHSLTRGVVFNTDIYASIGGTGPTVTIEYDEIG